VFVAGLGRAAPAKRRKRRGRNEIAAEWRRAGGGTERGLVRRQVVIRIDSLRQESALVLRVAGSIAGPDVAVLRDSVARQGLPDRIDLSEVQFVDAEGANELVGLEARGAVLVRTQPFIDLLLKTHRSLPH